MSRQLIHEIAGLESSLNILVLASRALQGPVDDEAFLKDEVPLAIEDAFAALERLRRLAKDLHKAA
ncbi:MAG: hypothetical protein AAGH87_00120 [Pseudomonadota bacterium]